MLEVGMQRMCVILVTLLVALTVAFAEDSDVKVERIVFLGDSITDGFSYPRIVRQALSEAGKLVPVCINAGIGGDTAKGMRARLDRDVLVHKPTRMTLSAGINDVLRNVSAEDYAADVRGILERMKREGVPVLVMTTSVLGANHEAADKRLESFNTELTKLAAEFGCAVADVNALMQEARKTGTEVLEEDQVHPNYAGHLVMARAVLNGLGSKDVAVPERMKVEPFPGVIAKWKVKALKDNKPMTDALVKSLPPDDTWVALSLPEKDLQTHWWAEQTRQEGFALSLEKLAGKAPRYVAVTTIDSKVARRAYINTGAQLQTVWLNGVRVYEAKDWTGYHAGRERIPVELREGANALLIETGPQFFVSVTEDNMW
jgi:lysophospholipase L1-like esterase